MELNYTELLEVLLLGSKESRTSHLWTQEDASVTDPASGNSLLHLVVYDDMVQEAGLLLSVGANLDVTNVNGETPLHWAAKRNSLKCAAFLIDKGADLNAIDNSGSSPVQCAADTGNADIVAVLLLNPDCRANTEDNDGFTALMIAKKRLLTATVKNRNSFLAIIAFLQRQDVAPIIRKINRNQRPWSGNPNTSGCAITKSRQSDHTKSSPNFLVRRIEYDVNKTQCLSSPSLPLKRRLSSPPMAYSRGERRQWAIESDIKSDADVLGTSVIMESTDLILTSELVGTPGLMSACDTIGDSPLIVTPDLLPPDLYLLPIPHQLTSGGAPLFSEVRNRLILPGAPLQPSSFGGLPNTPKKAIFCIRNQARKPSSAEKIPQIGLIVATETSPIFLQINIQSPCLGNYLDCLIIVEHCWDCESHSQSLRHQEHRYNTQANICIETIAGLLLEYNLPVRYFALKVRTDCKNDRNKIGALEITLSVRGINQMHRDEFQASEILGSNIHKRSRPANEIATIETEESQSKKNSVWNSVLLHSKLKSRSWPSMAGLKLSAVRFLSAALRESGRNLPVGEVTDENPIVQKPLVANALDNKTVVDKPIFEKPVYCNTLNDLPLDSSVLLSKVLDVGPRDYKNLGRKQLPTWVDCSAYATNYTVNHPIQQSSVSLSCSIAAYLSIDPTSTPGKGSEGRLGVCDMKQLPIYDDLEKLCIAE